MIFISAPTYDPFGHIVSHNGHAEQQSTSRRARRVATLDGGAVLVDGGYSQADLTYTVEIPDPTGAHHKAINRLIRLYPTAVLCCSFGCYQVLLSGLTSDDSNDQMTTRVTAEVVEVTE